MTKIKINKKRCKGCQLCIGVCPVKNIKLDTTLNERSVFPVVIIDEEKCSGCGLCFVMCPDVCIEIEGKS